MNELDLQAPDPSQSAPIDNLEESPTPAPLGPGTTWEDLKLPGSILSQVQTASPTPPKKKNTLLIGASGSGKSTMAASTYTEGPVHFLDLDNKFGQLAPELLTRYPDGTFTFQEFRGTLTGNTKIKVVAAPDQSNPKKGFDHEARPMAYQKLLNTVNAYLDIVEKAEKRGIDPQTVFPFKTIVLDSYTRLREHLRATIRKEQGHGIIDRTDWGVLLDNDVAFIHGFLSLPVNCIVICHETPVYNKEGNLVKLTPAIQGQFKDTIASHFQEVFFLRTEENRDAATKNTMPTVHWAFGKPDAKLSCARSSLTDFRRVPTDLGGIFAGKYRGEDGKRWFSEVEGGGGDRSKSALERKNGTLKTVASTGTGQVKKSSFGHEKKTE